MKNPLQPLMSDEQGILRFKQNKIVRDLLDFATERGFGLCEIHSQDYTVEDREQLAQLIGYSVSGFGELTYVRDETYNTASDMYKRGLDERDARIQNLEDTLDAIREGLKTVVPHVFRIHPEDLDV